MEDGGDDLDLDAGPDAGDAGSPWVSCNGARGMTLSCESYGAEPLRVSRFDAEQGCFEPATTVEGLCAVPTYCPGSSGEIACVVGGDGEPYFAFVRWGEEISSDWHHSDGPELGTNLTYAEADLCMEAGRAHSEASEQDESIVLDGFGSATVRPACAD